MWEMNRYGNISLTFDIVTVNLGRFVLPWCAYAGMFVVEVVNKGRSCCWTGPKPLCILTLSDHAKLR
jgi:hypothetical protein